RGRHVRADAWRLRLRGGIRHRAQVPRDAALFGGADLDQPHSLVSLRACSRAAEVVLVLPLSGLLVVSLEQAVAAPTCSCRLADAGARVIKIERPEGDLARGYDSLARGERDRKSTRLNSSHLVISYAVFCLKDQKLCLWRA